MTADRSSLPLGPLPKDWRRAPLRELVFKIGSGATPTGGSESYLARRDEFALIRSQNVFDHYFDSAGLAFISTQQADALRGARVNPGDLLLNITGDGVTFGRACLAPDDVLPACVNQHVSIIRVDPKRCLPNYLLAYLTLPPIKQYIESFNAGGSRRAITKGHIESFIVPLPPLAQQARIAEVVGAINEKIELNRRTSRVLEMLARATFKAWFVDFEPVKAKAAGQTSFPGIPPAAFAALPDRLTDSPLGPVPLGWKVRNIGEVVQRVAMGPFGSDIKTDNFVSEGVPVIRGGNLTDGFVDSDFVFLTDAKADQLASANAFPGDIVITHRGTLGQIGLIPTKSRYRRYVVSQSQMLIRPNDAMLPSHFLYLFLTSAMGQHELLANRSQTGVPAISRPTTSVKAIPLILPPRPIVAAFESFASTLFDARVVAEAESSKLAALRDYLLPRLLSGIVRVRE